ncbi:hypothetical protein NDU88_000880 [Pleurodeles waltl]|uniref:Uncharacterized protein n=1 Tax=Pleurodeles waltl TaxID=8319 RepID=A0AAV7V6N0_PLEWA|nr:hypothetical protein NDU88_000880 [Pleurodeles waltl]
MMRRSKGAHTPSRSVYPGASQEWSNSSATGGCIPPTCLAPLADKLDLTLQEIRESRMAVEHRIDSIALDLGILRDDHKKLADKVSAVEGTLTELVPQHAQNLDNLADFQLYATRDWLEQTYPMAHRQERNGEALTGAHKNTRHHKQCQKGASTAAPLPQESREGRPAALLSLKNIEARISQLPLRHSTTSLSDAESDSSMALFPFDHPTDLPTLLSD